MHNDIDNPAVIPYDMPQEWVPDDRSLTMADIDAMIRAYRNGLDELGLYAVRRELRRRCLKAVASAPLLPAAKDAA